MKITIYIEGGGDSKDLQIRCREGFRKLLENSGFTGKMPKLFACGGRENTFDDFTTAHSMKRRGDFIAMLVDSEDPVEDLQMPWGHLRHRDGWEQPDGAVDEQVLLMTTCMETWIVSDPEAVRRHYGARLRENALPPLVDLESRDRHSIQAALFRATKSCSNAYQKGKRSFALLAVLNPETLKSRLPSFARVLEILRKKS